MKRLTTILLAAALMAACSRQKQPLPECTVYEAFDNLQTLMATDSASTGYRVVTLYFRITNNTAGDCFVPVRTAGDDDSIYSSHFNVRVGNRTITPDVLGKGEPQAIVQANCSKAYKMRILAPGLAQLGLSPTLPLDSIVKSIRLEYTPVSTDSRFSKLPVSKVNFTQKQQK